MPTRDTVIRSVDIIQTPFRRRVSRDSRYLANNKSFSYLTNALASALSSLIKPRMKTAAPSRVYICIRLTFKLEIPRNAADRVHRVDNAVSFYFTRERCSILARVIVTVQSLENTIRRLLEQISVPKFVRSLLPSSIHFTTFVGLHAGYSLAQRSTIGQDRISRFERLHICNFQKKHLVGFKCPTATNCRHVWRCAIEQMLFFTWVKAFVTFSFVYSFFLPPPPPPAPKARVRLPPVFYVAWRFRCLRGSFQPFSRVSHQRSATRTLCTNGAPARKTKAGIPDKGDISYFTEYYFRYFEGFFFFFYTVARIYYSMETMLLRSYFAKI